MGLQLQVEDEEENVFEFDNFELVLHSSGSYLLCEEGFFSVDGLDSFKPFDDQYVIVNTEDNSKFFLTAEDFEKIKEIWMKHA